MKKSLWHFFSPIIEHENVGEQHFFKIHKVVRQLLCETYHHFYWTLEVDRKKTFQKRAVFRWPNFWPNFPELSSMINLREQLTRVHKLFLLILYSLPEHFLRPRKLLKSQIFEKKAIFPVSKLLRRLFFLVKSSVANLKGQIVEVQQVLRQILW